MELEVTLRAHKRRDGAYGRGHVLAAGATLGDVILIVLSKIFGCSCAGEELVSLTEIASEGVLGEVSQRLVASVCRCGNLVCVSVCFVLSE